MSNKSTVRNSKIKVFYNTKQVLDSTIDKSTNVSKSPLKPKLLLEFLNKHKLGHAFDITGDFEPFTNDDFRIAHTKHYVDGFFGGKDPICKSNMLSWSKQFADSVRYTNASLYNAIKHSVENPTDITFSPTSGFHHAKPNGGSGFCTFSGQVIASLKLYEEFGVSGCYLDLDGHFGNSIEDSRKFAPLLDTVVPHLFNYNGSGSNKNYVDRLSKFLYNDLKPALLNGTIDYVVWCHGADSHSSDDFNGTCDTEYWIECTKVFVKFIKEIDTLRSKLNMGVVPVSISLFGGYRRDEYNSVLSLHTADLSVILNGLCSREIKVERFTSMVVEKPIIKYVPTYDWSNETRTQSSYSPTLNLPSHGITYRLTTKGFNAMTFGDDQLSATAEHELLATLALLDDAPVINGRLLYVTLKLSTFDVQYLLSKEYIDRKLV